MSARDKVSCFDCDARIILKNLKVHYQRFHPTKPVKHRSINEKGVDKFFSNLKRKSEDENADEISSKKLGKSEEENADEISSKKLDIESSGKSFETTAPLEEHFTNSSRASNSHNALCENNLSSVIENDNQNKDCVSVNKDILNKILLSIQGKSFSDVLFYKILIFYRFNLK